MNSGSFFRLDLESSKIESGAAFYEYMDVPDFSPGMDKLKYPIRVSISSDSVLFFIHYIEEYNRLESPKEREEEFSKPHHAEEAILCLPFNSPDPEALSSIIKRVYTTSFPVSIYLKKVLFNRYIKKYKESDESEYKQLQDAEVNLDSYSALYVWGLIDKKRIVISKRLDSDCSNSTNGIFPEPEITMFLRKLLLDFMFDLRHSDVFESSKYYFQMREGLMNDFFFSSIVKKSEYYYYRRLVRTRFLAINDDCNYILASDKKKSLLMDEANKKEEILKRRLAKIEDTIETFTRLANHNCTVCDKVLRYLNKRKIILRVSLRITKECIKSHKSTDENIAAIKFFLKNLYAERLDSAEAIWIETIMNPLAEKHFSFSPEWYEDQGPQVKHDDYTFRISESWFVNPEEEMNRIAFPLKKPGTRDTLYLNSFELSQFIGSKNDSTIKKRNTSISKWYYRRFDFKDTFRLHFFHGWNDAFFITLLLISIVLTSCSCIWATTRSISIIPALLSFTCLCICIGFTVNTFKKRRSHRIDDVFISIRRRRESIRAFRLFVFFICAWSVLFFYESSIWAAIIVGVVCLVSLLLLVLKRNSCSGDSLHLFLPRLVASITTAWIMLVIGNDLVKEHISPPLCVIISTIVFVFILYEINKSLPSITKKGIVFRSLELMLISFSIALIVGIFAIDVLSPAWETDASTYHIPYAPTPWRFLSKEDGFSVLVFPPFLIQFSFLAMFIGVFIQMIFEEKNITEM